MSHPHTDHCGGSFPSQDFPQSLIEGDQPTLAPMLLAWVTSGQRVAMVTRGDTAPPFDLPQLPATWELIHLKTPPASPTAVKQAILAAIGLPLDQEEGDNAFQDIQLYLKIAQHSGRKVLLLVEEAQNLDWSALYLLTAVASPWMWTLLLVGDEGLLDHAHLVSPSQIFHMLPTIEENIHPVEKQSAALPELPLPYRSHPGTKPYVNTHQPIFWNRVPARLVRWSWTGAMSFAMAMILFSVSVGSFMPWTPQTSRASSVERVELPTPEQKPTPPEIVNSMTPALKVAEQAFSLPFLELPMTAAVEAALLSPDPPKPPAKTTPVGEQAAHRRPMDQLLASHPLVSRYEQESLAWWTNANKAHYTILLHSVHGDSHSLAKLTQYLDQEQKKGSQVYLLPVGQHWLGVYKGDFAEVLLARKELDAMRKNSSKSAPHLRRIGSLKPGHGGKAAS